MNDVLVEPPCSLTIPTLPPSGLRLPPPIAALERVVYNLAWSWDDGAAALCARVDPVAWRTKPHPLALLRAHAANGAITRMASDPAVVAEVESVAQRFDERFGPAPVLAAGGVAYFSAEFGVHASLPLYAGGLGVLAGDHLKSCSDLDVPLCGVSLLYRRGYFGQAINAKGLQEHVYPVLPSETLPILRVATPDGEPLFVPVELPTRRITCAVWVARVGRIPLFLLDTDHDQNARADRSITALLYVGDRAMRLRQELVLGVGGARALAALGATPAVWHLNEGHSAFLLVERLRAALAGGATFEQALAEVRERSVFTIHTPVPAGNERFARESVEAALSKLFEGTSVDPSALLDLGKGADGDPHIFDMTALCLRLSRGANGVSKLHGETATHTWQPVTGAPIAAVTNGVHMPTFVAPPLRALYARTGVERARGTEEILAGLARVSDAELWAARQEGRRALAERLFDNVHERHVRLGTPPALIEALEGPLAEDALTIGFARRFALYKRAGLLFRDLARLKRILLRADRPVRVIFAGKAHPADEPGQRLLGEVVRLSDDPELRGRVVFWEDYDLEGGKCLTQGVDVWLNTPRRPLEASGTSGMKAAANGAPNMSILDGWWDEGYDGQNGWAIGDRRAHADCSAQDSEDADAVYRLLEDEIVPRFYDRGADGVPSAWLATARRAIATSLWRFSSHRMVDDYRRDVYRL